MGVEESAGHPGPARDRTGDSVSVWLIGIWAAPEVPDLARDIARTALADFRGRTEEAESAEIAAEFPDAPFAARAAAEFERRLALFNRKTGQQQRAEIRIGLAGTIDSARRMAEQAAPGQILMARAVREALILEPDVRCTWIGKLGLERGQTKEDVYELRWAEPAVQATPSAKPAATPVTFEAASPLPVSRRKTPPPTTPMPISTDQATVDFISPPPSAPSAMTERYEILAEVGRGGMGVVYKARDRETSEIVALKVLKPEIAAETSVMERFKNELRLARKITHKNVCRIHEFNRTETSAYISMEMVEGDSLRSVLARFGPLSLRKGLDLARQMCQGLAEAHAQGVVHRDLKPENIMLDRTGNAKVMDFGIARAVDVGAATTGTIVGTPAYMAPEQAEGKPVDRRTDIYSLGLILYEMFAGAPAFTGDTPMSVALKQIREAPPPPREVEPSVPEHIEKAILRCLEKKPDKRFQSVPDLEAALMKAPVAAPVPQAERAPVTLPFEMANWVRFDWALLGSAVVGLALFFWLFYTLHPASALQITVDKKQQEQLALEALKKLGLKGGVESSDLSFGDDFDAYGLKLGSRVARNLELEGAVGIMGNKWTSFLKVEEGGGKYLPGFYTGGIRGRPLSIVFWGFEVSPATAPGPPPSAEEADRMRLRAQEVAVGLFGHDLSSMKPTPQVAWNTNLHRYIALFSWGLPGAPPSTSETISVTVDGSKVRSAEDSGRFNNWEDYDWQALEIPLRGLLACPVISFLILLIFIFRGVERQPRSAACLIVSALVGLLVAVAATAWPRPFGYMDVPILYVVFPALIFYICLLASYAVLKTALYYLRGRFPAQATSFIVLFEKYVRARPAGLALVRGILAGCAFSGLSLAVVSFAGLWGKAFPGTLYWAALSVGNLFRVGTGIGNLVAGFHGSGSYEPVLNVAGLDLWRLFPAVVVLDVGFAAWFLVALPLSLVGRLTARTWVLLVALAALWMALGLTLPGAMTIPRIPFYMMAAAQAAFFGWLFLRYGLLATWAAAFSVEALLLVYPLRFIFAIIDPLPYDLTLGLWFLMVLAALVIFFLPQLTWTWRRLAAVFE